MNHILRSASDLSVKCGTIFIDKLPQIAKNKNYSSIAITDCMNMFGFIKFYKSCLKQEIKPILGVELIIRSEIIGDYKILAYAKNAIGLKVLFKIISDAYLVYKDIYSDGEVVIPEEELFKLPYKNILLTSGGVFGFIGIMNKLNYSEEFILKEVEKWKDAFKDSFFIELNRFQSKKYDINKIFKLSYNIANKLNLKYITTNPIYFENEDDYVSHSIRVCAMNSETLNKGLLNSIESEYTYDMYFKEPEDYLNSYNDLENLNENMDYFVSLIDIKLKLNFNDLPNYEIPKDKTIESYFEEKVFLGLEKKLKSNFNQEEYENSKEKYYARASFEIETIKNMKFIGYFLIVADFINWAKNNDIPVGPGRGSGAGSIVAYSLGITDIDPIPYDLLFERFLNPERVSMPDFDIDFCQDKRGLVIEYVQKKYGKDAVSQIMTTGTMATRSVIKDVARVLGLPYGLADNITQKIGLKQTSLEEAYSESIPENIGLQKMIDNNELAKEIWDNGLKLEGITKSIGKHAAGILIAPTKIIDYCPIYHSDGMPVSQLDKNDVEYAGLVKFDFLGLKNLTVIQNAIKFVKDVNNLKLKKDIKNYDNKLEIKADFKDIDAYKLLQEGNTTAVFQLESNGMKKYLKKMLPDCFEDIIAILALYRPGPLGSGMVDSFIKRKLWEKNGKPSKENDNKFDYKYEVSDYFTKELEDCLKPTYGIIVYQEQVMKISQILAGYTLGGADLLRRAMGKKDLKEMSNQRAKFINGAISNNFSEKLAIHLFDLMEKFAEYGFNKSHSAAYAVITYQTAYLKAHYPIEFMAATLYGEEDNTEKLEIFIRDCQENKIIIYNPNINTSETHFTPNETGILYSLSALKGVGSSIAESVIKERKEGGEYISFENFCSRNVNVLNKKMLSSFIRAGCFDCFNENRAKYYDAITDVLKQKTKIVQSKYDSVSLFDEYNVEKIYVSEKFSQSNWDILDKIKHEVEGIGFELTVNMYSKYKEKIEKIADSVTPKYFLDPNHLFILERNNAIKGNMIYNFFGVIQDHIETQNPRLIIKDDIAQIQCNLNQRLLKGSYKLTKESIKKNKFIQCKMIVRVKEIEGIKRYFYSIIDIVNVFD